jgi:hypothetical protein
MKPGLTEVPKAVDWIIQNHRKFSDVNYQFMDQNNKSQVVHVFCLKITHNTDIWKPRQYGNAAKETREKVRKHIDEEEDEFRIGSLPMQIPNYDDRAESETPCVQIPNTIYPVQQMVETPLEMTIKITAPQKPPDPVEKCKPREQNPFLQGREQEVSQEE